MDDSGEKKKEKVIDIIKKRSDFLIISHNYPDGDSLGTQTALYGLLVSIGKKVKMVCNSEIPYQYMFLTNIDRIESGFDSFDIENKKYVTFCVDSATEDRLNIDFEYLKKISDHIINIDHHKDNTRYGSINIIEPSKSAAAEILYRIIEKGFFESFNRNIAECIYTAILTDTGKFQYSSTTSSVHKITAHLIELGVEPAAIYSEVYENDPIERFKLLAKALSRIDFDKETATLYSYVLKDDFNELALPFSAHNGIIEMLRSGKGAEVVALFKEIETDHFKVSLRSSGDADVSKIASSFGGGGHKMAAAYEFKGSLKAVSSTLLDVIKDD